MSFELSGQNPKIFEAKKLNQRPAKCAIDRVLSLGTAELEGALGVPPRATDQLFALGDVQRRLPPVVAHLLLVEVELEAARDKVGELEHEHACTQDTIKIVDEGTNAHSILHTR